MKYYAYLFHESGGLAINASHEYNFEVADQKTYHFPRLFYQRSLYFGFQKVWNFYPELSFHKTKTW